MRRTLVLAALAAVLALPAGLGAQQRQMSTMYRISGHPRLGVTVNMQSDSSGAEIVSVLPGSPADEAGLQAHDVITRFNGTELASADEGAGQKLVDMAQALDAGDTARIEYRRDGKSHQATIVARELPNTFSFTMPDMERFRMRAPEPGVMPDMGMNMPFGFMVRSGGLELADMNKDLGQYFGTDEGVLVLSTPADSASPLKAGDVLLSIDGRTVQSVDHANRILASYADGEKITAQVMRKQKKTTLTWTAHRPDTVHWRQEMRPGSPAPGRGPKKL